MAITVFLAANDKYSLYNAAGYSLWHRLYF